MKARMSERPLFFPWSYNHFGTGCRYNFYKHVGQAE
jgi:hypothetical protein